MGEADQEGEEPECEDREETKAGDAVGGAALHKVVAISQGSGWEGCHQSRRLMLALAGP